MFTIDLLKGAGKPTKSHPLWAAGATLAFMALLTAGALDVALYYRHTATRSALTRSLSYYDKEVAGLADVAKALEEAEKHRAQANAALAEVNKALSMHAKWSPILVTLVEKVPPEITLTDTIARRLQQGSGDKTTYAYSITVSVATSSGAPAIEQLVRTLRQALPLMPGPDSVRIVSQRQEILQGRGFERYLIECRLKL